MAKRLKLAGFVETSAKDEPNFVDDAFFILVTNCYDKLNQQIPPFDSGEGTSETPYNSYGSDTNN